jgi:hypothetical protein
MGEGISAHKRAVPFFFLKVASPGREQREGGVREDGGAKEEGGF